MSVPQHAERLAKRGVSTAQSALVTCANIMFSITFRLEGRYVRVSHAGDFRVALSTFLWVTGLGGLASYLFR
jgi:hypothetical protein